VKADFIRAKYQFLAFVNKHKDAEITLDDINKVCWTDNSGGHLPGKPGKVTEFQSGQGKVLKSVSLCS